ncbi:tetratricopeptide repeat protein, partial [bacterium]|nr:tetratricopeptide repeat protein [bacterium]
NKGELKKSMNYYMKAFDTFKKIGNIRSEASAFNDIGSVLWSENDFENALSYFKKFLNISKKIGDKQSIGRALGNIGLTYTQQEKYKKALKALEEHLIISKEIGSERGIASSCCNIGNIYYETNDFNKALKYYERYYQVSRKIEDKRGTGIALGNIGIVYGMKGELDTALNYYKKALTISKTIGYRRGVSEALVNIALSYQYKKDYNNAVKYYKETMTVSNKVDYLSYATSALGLGKIYMEKGKFEKSKKCLYIARKTFVKINDQSGIAEIFAQYSELYRLQNQIIKSRKYLDQCKNLSKEIDEDDMNPIILQIQAKFIITTKEEPFDKAVEYFKQAMKITKENNLLFDYRDAILGLADAYKENGNNKLAEKYFKKAKEIFNKLDHGI